MKVELGKEKFNINFTKEELKMANDTHIYARYMDNLGRIVIPEEFKEYFGFNCDEPIKVCFTDEGVLLKPFFSKEKRKEHWVEKMLAEMKADNNSYTSSYSSIRKTTILTCFPPKNKNPKTSYAFCSKRDKYNERVGLAVAYAKMMGYSIPKYL